MKNVFPSRKQKTPELRMTPMIDVIFLLLIFFVCTANFRPLEGVLPTHMALSGSSTVEIVLPDPQQLDVARIRLTFEGSPRWQVESNPCASLREVRELLVQLREIKSDLPIIIDCDGNVPMEHLIELYDVCRWAGLSQIRFAAALPRS